MSGRSFPHSGITCDARTIGRDPGTGQWGAFEVKLGTARLDETAENLLAFAQKIDTGIVGELGVLDIITSDEPAYRRADGVHLIPVGCLGP